MAGIEAPSVSAYLLCACGLQTLPCSLFHALFLPHPLSEPSWLPWQRCSGYQVAAGGREPALLQTLPFLMPSTHQAHWLGLIWGPLGHPSFTGFSLTDGT